MKEKDKVTPEAVKAFIADADRSRKNWLTMADRSWSEIKREQKNKRLWTTIPNSVRKKTKYPAWYSIFKIRQPLWLSRVGIPIGKDTTQDGNDNLGAVAAIIKERLAINLAKSFDFFDVMSCARDDCLATNFGMVRAYYEATDVKEQVKIRLTPIPQEDGTQIFIDPEGEQVISEDISQDDEGFFLETEEVIDVKDEKVCLEPVLYRDCYIDPSIRRWSRCKQLAFEELYTELEFKAIFGAKAYAKLPKDDDGSDNKGKKFLVKVYEYWDFYTKEVRWLPALGDEFIYPKEYLPEQDTEEDLNGIYDLEGFFPTPKPLVINQATDHFWPIPEYFQVVDILEDIHTIFSRMMLLTKSIRSRLLFDNNVEGLASALNELSEADAIGVSNLSQALVNTGGSIEGVVQYIPVEKMIQSLDQMYQALEQRLNTLYKLTGTSDLLQGLITDPTQRTFGERQMLEKYALNQSAEGQRKMAEFVRDSYELLCEMALKNFKDESLLKYTMPETLDEDKKALYQPALELLKSNNKRFRIELETDSTIALNEEFDKQMRMQLVDTISTALEKTANIAQNSPALIVPELHLLKFLIQGFRQGKLFQSEVSRAIDQVIQQAEAQQENAAFNKDEANNQIKQQELQLKNQELLIKAEEFKLKSQEIQSNLSLEQYQVQSKERYEIAKLQQDERLAQIEAQQNAVKAQNDQLLAQVQMQIETVKAQDQQQKTAIEAQANFQKLTADIAIAQEELQIKREELALQMQGLVDKSQLDQINLMLESRIAEQENELAHAKQSLEEQRMILVEQEKFATEQRLQSEHQLQQLEMAMKAAREEQQQKIETVQMLAPQVPIAKPKKKKRKVKIIRDEEGEMKDIQIEQEEEE